MNTHRSRLQWVDALRGILILLVVLGHCIQLAIGPACVDNVLYRYIYSFHMPAFFAVSGYLNFRSMHSHRSRPEIFRRRIGQLLIPFLCWSVIMIIVYWTNVRTRFTDAFVRPDIGYWFLWVLFWVNAVFLFADWVSDKLRIRREIGEVGMALILVVVMVLTEYRLLGFQFIAYYFLFYLVGYYFHKYRDSLPTHWALLAFLTVLWAVLAWFYHAHTLPTFLNWLPVSLATLGLYSYRFGTALLACYVLLAWGPVLFDKCRALGTVGKVSLGIYVIHILFCPRLVSWLVSSLGPSRLWLAILLAFVVTAGVSFVLAWLLSKWKVTARVLLGKIPGQARNEG